jgi:hypothetical protein
MLGRSRVSCDARPERFGRLFRHFKKLWRSTGPSGSVSRPPRCSHQTAAKTQDFARSSAVHWRYGLTAGASRIRTLGPICEVRSISPQEARDKARSGALEKTWQPVRESAAGSFALQRRVAPRSRPDRFVERAGRSPAVHFRHNPRPHIPLAWLGLPRRSPALSRRPTLEWIRRQLAHLSHFRSRQQPRLHHPRPL